MRAGVKSFHLIAAWLAALILCPPPTSGAEVFKCRDEDGQVSYQDRTCQADTSSTAINTDYANEISMRIPEAELKLIKDQLKQTAANRKRKVDRRNQHIDEVLRHQGEKEARCEKATKGYLDLLAARRRHGYIKADEEIRLLQAMHEACSA